MITENKSSWIIKGQADAVVTTVGGDSPSINRPLCVTAALYNLHSPRWLHFKEPDNERTIPRIKFEPKYHS